MRRMLVPALLVLVVAVAGLPSGAVTTGAVVAVGNQFVPGDRDLGAEQGAPGVAKLEVRHLQGRELRFANADMAPHTLTSELRVGNPSVPRFGSDALVRTGETVDVRGVNTLLPGSYNFLCRVHQPSMDGILIIVAAP